MENNNTEIRKQFDEIFLDEFTINEEDLKNNVSFESLGIDSLDKITFIFELEKEFDIDIQDNDIDNLKTPNELFEYVLPLITKK